MLIVSYLQSDIFQTALQHCKGLIVCQIFSVLDVGEKLYLVKRTKYNTPVFLLKEMTNF